MKREQEAADRERELLAKQAAEAAALEALNRKREEDAAAAERRKLEAEEAERQKQIREEEELKALRSRVDIDFDLAFHISDSNVLPALQTSQNDGARLWLLGFKAHGRGPKSLPRGNLSKSTYCDETRILTPPGNYSPT